MTRGVILDIDGTLVLSNDEHAEAWVLACRDFGYDVPYERVRPLIGMGGDRVVPEIMPGLSEEEGIGKRVAKRRQEIFLQRFAPTIKAAPGARDLVAHMRKVGLRLIVGTSAKEEELGVLLKAAKVEDLLTEATTSDETESSKPAPDVIHVALDKLGLPAADVIMIGDTPFDVESAKRAGVGAIAVRCGGFGDIVLRDALAIYDDPADILAQYDDSPLATANH